MEVDRRNVYGDIVVAGRGVSALAVVCQLIHGTHRDAVWERVGHRHGRGVRVPAHAERRKDSVVRVVVPTLGDDDAVPVVSDGPSRVPVPIDWNRLNRRAVLPDVGHVDRVAAAVVDRRNVHVDVVVAAPVVPPFAVGDHLLRRNIGVDRDVAGRRREADLAGVDAGRKQPLRGLRD